MRNKPAAIIVLLAAAFFASDLKMPDLNWLLVSGTDNTVKINTPSEANQKAVAPLIGLITDPQDKSNLVSLYLAMSKSLDAFETKSQVRSFYSLANTTYKKTTGKMFNDLSPGLGTKLDKALEEMLGLESGQVDKTKTAKAFEAIAWAISQ